MDTGSYGKAVFLGNLPIHFFGTTEGLAPRYLPRARQSDSACLELHTLFPGSISPALALTME